jgi:hypothetical protein
VNELFERLGEVDISDTSVGLLSAAIGLAVGGALAGVTGVWWLPIATAVAITVAALLPIRTHAKHRRH